MYTSTLLYLLPLLSLSLPTSAAGGPTPREIYEAASRRAALSPRDDTDSHGHGKYNALLNSHGHGHVGRRSHGGGLEGKKLVRRKKVKAGKRAGSTCRASSASESTATATLEAQQNNAIAKSSSSSSSSSASTSTYAEETAYPTMSSSTTAEWQSSATSASATASSTTSSESAASTSSSGSSLFPWGTGSASWTTSDGTSFESVLKPLTAGKLPSHGTSPDGSDSLVANFPAGTVGLSSAGFSFYTTGAHDGVEVDSANEVSFSYSVYLKDGFNFVKGGKMPGLYGGTSLSQAKSCSGGRQDSRDSCFSARLMWRTNGQGEIYDYLPVPYTDTDTGYGESIQRGAYEWATGKWTTVAMRVKLNDVGSSNGEQELVVDGHSVISLKDVTFATSEGTKIYGIMAQTFFGGHTDDWASPTDQNIWFKDWSLAVLS